MKLTKQKKERIEAYLDMLQFNGDMMSYFNTQAVIPILEVILYSEKYNKNDKPLLLLLESRFPKHKIVFS